uniref:Uncharacterized protein n=1 Tax=Leersia perrieri TaxID=77586 RepID=A0A0D9WQM0_9ORYZ
MQPIKTRGSIHNSCRLLSPISASGPSIWLITRLSGCLPCPRTKESQTLRRLRPPPQQLRRRLAVAGGSRVAPDFASFASAERCSELSPCPQILRTKFNSLSLSGKVSTKPTLHSWIVAGKLKGPKLDDGSGGFPPFRFGKGGGGGGSGGGGSNYFGGFLLFTCVLLMDYLKELEKTLLLQRHRIGDEATAGLAQ